MTSEDTPIKPWYVVRLSLIHIFISKMGRPFAAILRISDEYKLEFD